MGICGPERLARALSRGERVFCYEKFQQGAGQLDSWTWVRTPVDLRKEATEGSFYNGNWTLDRAAVQHE